MFVFMEVAVQERMFQCVQIDNETDRRSKLERDRDRER